MLASGSLGLTDTAAIPCNTYGRACVGIVEGTPCGPPDASKLGGASGTE